MIKKFIYITVIVSLTGFLSSCGEEFLEKEPVGSVPTDEVFNSLSTARAAMTGMYDQLGSPNLDGLYTSMMNDVIGEDVLINSVDNWNWFVTVYQLEVLPNYTWTEYVWQQAYKVINDANNLIAGAPSIPDAGEIDKNNLMAHGRSIRAYIYLEIVQMYATAYSVDPDAPGIMLLSDPSSAQSADVPRSTLREVYQQIEADLLWAEEHLEGDSDIGYFTQRSVRALLARMYLQMEEWQKAADYARLAYEEVNLMTIEDMFESFYREKPEWLFKIAFLPDDNNIFLSLPSFYWPVAGYSSMRADDDFVDKFDDQDARKQFFLTDPSIDEDNYLILKFGHNQTVGNAEMCRIRASEMYLIEAEAEAELGNYSTAQDALYTIMSRSHGGALKPSETGQDLIDLILLERRKELFGEGIRWQDIKRRNQPFVREGKHWSRWNIQPTDEDYYRLTFPIPQREMDSNTALTPEDQNAGY